VSGEARDGERVMAFFDLDGTLIPEPSLEMRFFAALRQHDEIPFANYLRWGVQALHLLPQGLLPVQHGNKRYLAGVCSELASKYLESIAFFKEGVERIEWHARKGHEVVLLTGTLEPLARLAATALECELEARGLATRFRICATRLEQKHGRWTGHLVGDALFAQTKARAMEQLARTEKVDLRQCHGYGNSLTDRYFLSAVGHANAVNAGRDMAAVANERGWTIWHWHLEKKLDAEENAALTEGIQ
jgi:phosphoserine phosphatase